MIELSKFSPAEISMLTQRNSPNHFLAACTLTDLVWRDVISIFNAKNPNSRSNKVSSWFAVGKGFRREGLEMHERFLLESGFSDWEKPVSPTAMMSACWDAVSGSSYELMVEQVMEGKLGGKASSYGLENQNPFRKKNAASGEPGWWRMFRKLVGLRGRKKPFDGPKLEVRDEFQKARNLFQSKFPDWVTNDRVKAWQQLKQLGGSVWLIKEANTEAMIRLAEAELSSMERLTLDKLGISDVWRERFSPTAIDGLLQARYVIEEFFKRKFEDSQLETTSRGDTFLEVLNFLTKIRG